MKKILIAMVLFVFVALPMSVMAMTAITDNDLSSVTGQAGVSIGADITMNLSFGAVAWGDPDGLDGPLVGTHDVGSNAGGWVGISNLEINNLRIHMRTDLGMRDEYVALHMASMVSYTPTAPGSLEADMAGDNGVPQQVKATEAAFLSVLATEQFLTIDVYTTNATNGYDGKTYVRIGLPTFEITIGDLTLEAGLWTNHVTSTLIPDRSGVKPGATGYVATYRSEPGTYQRLGQVYVGGLTVLVDKNNFVDIGQSTVYDHKTWGTDTSQFTNSGVLIHVGNSGSVTGFDNVDQNLMHVSFTAASWGDLDGLSTGLVGGAGGKGFVGITGMDLAVKMDMYIDINVGTATGGGISTLLTELTTIPNMTVFGIVEAGLLAQLQANSPFLKDDIASILHAAGTIGRTSVDIALHGTIGISKMETQVILATNAALNGAYVGTGFGTGLPGAETGQSAGILGNLYIGGLQVEIVGGPSTPAVQSWVSISAH